MKRKATVTDVLTDAVIIFCGAAAAVCAVPTAYTVYFSFSTLALQLAPTALVLSIIFHAEKWGWIGAAVLVPALIYRFYRTRAFIAFGYRLISYAMLRPLSLDHSFLPLPVVPSSTMDPVKSATAFMFLCAAIFAFLIAPALIRSRSALPGLLIPLPTLLMSLVYTDCVPDIYVMLLLAVYIGGLLLGREVRKSGARRAFLVKGVPFLLAVCTALLPFVLSPEQKYTPIPFSERQKMIGDSIGRVQDGVFGLFSRSPRDYDLTGEEDRFTSEKKAFAVRSNRGGTYLLRTHSYGRYDGSTWLAADEYTGPWNSLCALGSTQGGDIATLFVRDAISNERITPYAFYRDEQVSIGESYVRAGGKTAYYWTFMPRLRFVPVRPTAEENEYYQFALKQYTMPAGKQKELMMRLIESAGLKQTASLSAYDAAMVVSQFVRSSAVYTLTPGSLPEGWDFVEYFLTKSHRGYCVHFASAATALLQALGFPARYVIGYRAVIPMADAWTDIPEKCAHAWTEVYVKGVGWIPVDSTGAFPDRRDYMPSGYVPPEATPVPVPAPRPSGTDEPVPDTERPERSPRPTRDIGEDPTPSVTAAPGPGGANKARSYLWLLAVPAAILAWEAVGFIVRRRREREFSQEDSRMAVLALLRYYDRLEQHGARTEPRAKALADEAAFSTHDMSAERRYLKKRVKQASGELYRHKPLKRFIYKHILHMI